ncbi:hypothetical protein [Acidithiobacillus sp. AMEEHan]|uniref:hypothetical protein n=1 Tax=Acidithiobacillus sp. AMEEHan TaxID=2994951 RepID=UPI0027E57C71|nr:hypothetical protein [Acidithiobacillus sp. AMEEHan]
MKFNYRKIVSAMVGTALGIASLAYSVAASADDLNLGVAVPGLSLYLGNAPRYYVAPPVVYVPPRPIYYAPPPPRVVVYQPAPRWRPGPPPWAGRWHHGRDRDWDDGWHRDWHH